MTGAELDAVDAALPAAPGGLGPAAERFARNTLRKSAQTRRTYLSVYRRFAAHRQSPAFDLNGERLRLTPSREN
jgi:hypothetical protein